MEQFGHNYSILKELYTKLSADFEDIKKWNLKCNQL